jgi:high-affinity nickel-transport protein
MAGYVIVGLFVVTWVAALAYWRLARVEERFALTSSGCGASIADGANPSTDPVEELMSA